MIARSIGVRSSFLECVVASCSGDREYLVGLFEHGEERSDFGWTAECEGGEEDAGEVRFEWEASHKTTFFGELIRLVDRLERQEVHQRVADCAL